MFPPEQEQDYRSTRRESKHELATLTKEQSPRDYRAYIELFFRSTFLSSVVVVLGLLAQLVSSDVMRRSAVIAINLFFIPPLYASGVPRKTYDS
jgi:hypothetical protein